MISLQEFKEIFWSVLDPWHFMLISLSYLPSATLHLYRTNGLTAFCSWNLLQNAWFSRFWAWAGPSIREGRGPLIAALLQGRITQGKVGQDVVNEPLGGVILDIGPGPGYWVDLYANSGVPLKKHGVNSHAAGEGIEKIYGIEPNIESHPGLQHRIDKSGLDGVYEILPIGIEAISASPNGKTKIEEGTVDCIVSLLCLCSIPEPEKNIQELYKYLKKGGRWYIYEHVVTKETWPMRIYQGIVNIFWPYALGGCQLRRDTEKALRQAGPWSKIDIERPYGEAWHNIAPHILGTLTK